MKLNLALVLALIVLIAVVGLTAMPRTHGPTDPAAPARGRLLEGGEACGAPCLLLVEGGPRTTVDRGRMHALADRPVLVGAYRYQEEPQGRTLYVYDDVQDLLGRVVNPRAVRVVDDRP